MFYRVFKSYECPENLRKIHAEKDIEVLKRVVKFEMHSQPY